MTHDVFISQDVMFHEYIFPFLSNSPSTTYSDCFFLIVSYPFIPRLCLHHLIILPPHLYHIKLTRHLPTFKIIIATLIPFFSPLHFTLSQRSSSMKSYLLHIMPLSMLSPHMLNQSLTLRLYSFRNGEKQ